MVFGDWMKNICKIILCIFICYLLIGIGWMSKDYIVHQMCKDGIPILGYHGIVSNQEKQEKYSHNQYFMSESEFEKQMKYLYENNYQCLTMQNVNDYYHGKIDVDEKSVCLTFDDGYKNFNTVVKPILQKYHLKATCFVIGYKTTLHKPLYLEKEDLQNDEYVEYYSHSYNLHHIAHLPRQKLIETLSVEEIADDFEANKDIVSSDYFAFPYGVSCKNAETYLKSSSVKLAFGYNQNRTMTTKDNQYLLPRYLVFSNIPMFIFEWWIE